MGKMLLILLIGSGVIFSFISLNMNSSNTTMLNNSYLQYEQTQAKDYAESGIDLAMRQLSSDTTWSGIANKAMNNGWVSIRVTNTNSKFYNGPNMGVVSGRQIVSVGSYNGSIDTVAAVVQFPNVGGNQVPQFFKYAIATDHNLSLNGSTNIVDDGNTQWNADVHTNQNFSMNGNNLIKGFLTYVGTATSNPTKNLQTKIIPNQNPQNLANYRQTSPVNIPTFDASKYKSLATEVHNGDYTVNGGNITLGTKTNPKIVYVGGNLTLNGSITGYGAFIVQGNITLNGNVQINSSDPSCSNLGLYAVGSVTVNGNVTIQSQIYANGNVTLNGNASVYGSITNKGSLVLNGNINIYYRPANGNLTAEFWQTPGQNSKRPVLLSYYEKNS